MWKYLFIYIYIIGTSRGNKAYGDLALNKYGITQTDNKGGLSHAYLREIVNEYEGHL